MSPGIYPTTARWLKFVIRSNWGNASYTELMELEAYGQPVSGPVSQAPLTLTLSGMTVTGCYYNGAGTLSGTTDGRVVQFEWRQDGGKRVGTAMMVLSAKGVAADHLTAKGYGKTQPVADNATPQGRALNRRVELTKKN